MKWTSHLVVLSSRDGNSDGSLRGYHHNPCPLPKSEAQHRGRPHGGGGPHYYTKGTGRHEMVGRQPTLLI